LPVVVGQELVGLTPTTVDDLGQYGGVQRIAARVVRPARAEHGVVHGAHQPGLATGQRRPPVRERHVQHRPAAGPDEQRLDADLTGRVVEPVRAHPVQVGGGRAGVPRSAGQPPGQQFELGRPDLGPVQQRHAAMLTTATGPPWTVRPPAEGGRPADAGRGPLP
jgi:hypothetical protein